jgi:hypothetical protein
MYWFIIKGMAAVGLLPQKQKQTATTVPHLGLLFTSALDFLGNLVGAVGMFYAGSGVST